MISTELLEQLKGIFLKLENKVTLIMNQSTHEKQTELEVMLTQVAQSSNLIEVVQSQDSSTVPSFSIGYQGKKTGVSFRGIPGGHEFSSLILAILNADGKGKMPDEGIVQRIKNLKEINLRTYISLSCENCPEVVQALNLMALINPKLSHEMVNGELVTEEVESLGIQGVPSVFKESKMISSGKNSLGDLLSTIESIAGSESSTESLDLGEFDVSIVGGGPAGVSSAIYLARKGLKVALVTSNVGGQVKETKAIENLISVVYTEGPELAAALSKHLDQYPVKIFDNRQVKEVLGEGPFEVVLTSKEKLSTKKIIVATGAKWRELQIPGEKEFLGKGVAFCPHCDGPFYKGKDIAVVGGGNSGVEAAIDLSGIARSITLIEYNSNLKADKVLVDKLNSLSNVKVLTSTKTLEVRGEGRVQELLVERSGEKESIALDGVFVQIGLVPNSQFVKTLVKTNAYGEIEVDLKGRTSKEGIYAAGDVTTTPYKQIIISMGEGAKVALTCFEDLVLKA